MAKRGKPAARQANHPETIILHHSKSTFGDKALIDEWHCQRGWAGCGYHYVILNGFRTSQGPYSPQDDGLIEVGREIDVPGAHCPKNHMNFRSIGICLIGDRRFTVKQFLSLKRLFLSLPHLPVSGHREYMLTDCPGFDCMPKGELDALLSGRLPEEMR